MPIDTLNVTMFENLCSLAADQGYDSKAFWDEIRGNGVRPPINIASIPHLITPSKRLSITFNGASDNDKIERCVPKYRVNNF